MSCSGETTKKFIDYLITHGAQTVTQLKNAGLYSGVGSRLPLLVKKGFIVRVKVFNENSGDKYAPSLLVAYKATEKKYTTDRKRKYGQFKDKEAYEKKKRAILKAIKLLEQLDSRYPFGEHSAQTQLDLSYAYFKNGDSETAIASADRFIKTHPRHPNVDYAYYLKALVNFNRDLGFIDRYVPSDATQRDTVFTQTAYLSFAELIKRFPNSQYVSDAEQRMISLENIMARHELHIARFYMEREAFLAAANRVNYILQNYPRTPAVPYALEIQIEAYKVLGLKQLADDSARIYAYNYPDGPTVSEADPSDVVVIPFIWDILGFDD